MPRSSRERTRTGGKRARAEATEGPRMQTTTIALDEETHLRLRRLALEEKTSFRELIRDAIADLLARRGPTRSGQAARHREPRAGRAPPHVLARRARGETGGTAPHHPPHRGQCARGIHRPTGIREISRETPRAR